MDIMFPTSKIHILNNKNYVLEDFREHSRKKRLGTTDLENLQQGPT